MNQADSTSLRTKNEVETNFLSIEGPNGKMMRFDGTGKRILDAGENMDPLEIEYYNARSSGDQAALQKIIHKLRPGLEVLAVRKLQDLEQVYQQGGKFRKELTKQEQESLDKRTTQILLGIFAVGLGGITAGGLRAAIGFSGEWVESAAVQGAAWLAANPERWNRFNRMVDFAKGYLFPPLEPPATNAEGLGLLYYQTRSRMNEEFGK